MVAGVVQGTAVGLLALFEEPLENRVCGRALFDNTIVLKHERLKVQNRTSGTQQPDGDAITQAVVDELVSTYAANRRILISDGRAAIENIPFENTAAVL